VYTIVTATSFSYHKLLCGGFERTDFGEGLILEIWLFLPLDDGGHLFSTENTSVVLGIATVDIVHEALQLASYSGYISNSENALFHSIS
jgi:hypothetical protein